MKKFFTVILVLLSLVLIFIGVNLGLNKFNKTNFEQLSENDQTLISDLDRLDKIIKDKPLWTNFDIQNKSLVLANGRFKYSYIINPQVEPSGLGVTKINLPSDYNISVYRMAGVAYNNLQFHIAKGNFNTINQSIKVYNNDIFYIRYDNGRFDREDDGYIISFIAHEAFHYYMQKNWTLTYKVPEIPISDQGAQTLATMYTLNGEMQTNIVENGSNDALIDIVYQYNEQYQSLKNSDPEYASYFASQELNEGTAQFVGYSANLDLERQSILFPNPTKKGIGYFLGDYSIDIRQAPDPVFYTRSFPYHTGKLLCLVLDKVGPSDWQAQLNTQSIESPIFLQDILASI